MPSSPTPSTICRGATYRTCRTIESGEKSIACAIDFPPAVAHELAANDRVVTLEQIAPLPVTKIDRPGRRVDNVGEQDGREHPVRFCSLPCRSPTVRSTAPRDPLRLRLRR